HLQFAASRIHVKGSSLIIPSIHTPIPWDSTCVLSIGLLLPLLSVYTTIAAIMTNANKSPSRPTTFTIHTSLLFDSVTAPFLPNISLTVSPSTNLITSFYSRTTPLPTYARPPDNDLRQISPLPPASSTPTPTSSCTPTPKPSPSIKCAMNPSSNAASAPRTISAPPLLAGYTHLPRTRAPKASGAADVPLRDTIKRKLRYRLRARPHGGGRGGGFFFSGLQRTCVDGVAGGGENAG
ncbi:hypothetical protein LTS18_008139, partial [Coniosporium uncinatum]